MILYLDTSSWLKLFLEEPGGDGVRARADEADVLVTSKVGLPEAAGVLARRVRAGDLTDGERTRVWAEIDGAWSSFVTIALDEGLAAQLAARHRLRALDSIHLAAALTTTSDRGEVAVCFSSFDARLNEAAAAEGLAVLAA